MENGFRSTARRSGARIKLSRGEDIDNVILGNWSVDNRTAGKRLVAIDVPVADGPRSRPQSPQSRGSVSPRRLCGLFDSRRDCAAHACQEDAFGADEMLERSLACARR